MSVATAVPIILLLGFIAGLLIGAGLARLGRQS